MLALALALALVLVLVLVLALVLALALVLVVMDAWMSLGSQCKNKIIAEPSDLFSTQKPKALSVCRHLDNRPPFISGASRGFVDVLFDQVPDRSCNDERHQLCSPVLEEESF